MGLIEPIIFLLGTMWFILGHGGWIVLVAVGVGLLWRLFVLYNQNKYTAQLHWINLAIDVPKANEQTFLAVEQIFAQLHSIHVSHTFGEKYFHGHVILWISLEIVSFGGQTKFIIRTPDRFRNLIESSIYAHYPDAEIKEEDDYIKNLPPYDPDKSYYDVWGTEMKLKNDPAYPIRTYRAFEHQASQIIVDPLAGVLESLASIQPHEFMAVQIMVRPRLDEWKEKARKLVDELKGVPKEKPKPGVIGDIAAGVAGGLAGIVSGAAAEEARSAGEEYHPPSLMQHLSPGQRDVIAAIEQNLAKIGYDTKIRIMYLAPKDRFRKDVKQAIVGAFRQFDDISLNGFKPDTRRTWTAIPFKFSETLEKPFIEYLVNFRKRKLVRFYKSRSFSKGAKSFILNIEALATLFHFPILTVKTPAITKTESKKGEAPINLPVQY